MLTGLEECVYALYVCRGYKSDIKSYFKKCFGYTAVNFHLPKLLNGFQGKGSV